MKSFSRADNEFIDAAADDSRRHAKIEEITQRRSQFHWLAWGMTACALLFVIADIFSEQRNSGAMAPFFFAAAIQWMQVFKCESDLRLLKLVEKLKN